MQNLQRRNISKIYAKNKNVYFAHPLNQKSQPITPPPSFYSKKREKKSLKDFNVMYKATKKKMTVYNVMYI